MSQLIKKTGKFTFPKTKIVKQQELMNKKDKRKKLIKTDVQNTNNTKKRIIKGETGITIPTLVQFKAIEKPKEEVSFNDLFKPYDFSWVPPIVLNDNEYSLQDLLNNKPDPEENKPEIITREVEYEDTPYFRDFNKYYDYVEQYNPEAKKYRNFLTAIADHESKFNPVIQNTAGAPAYGYFQFMQDGQKYKNIEKYANTDIDTFRNNPILQIEAAIKLAKAFEKGLTEKDLEKAKELNISLTGLLGGAWLGGLGGLRNYLHKNINASDSKWYKDKSSGSNIQTAISRYNNL